MTGDGIAFLRAANAVREELGQAHRFAHVLAVARLAARLARLHGEDPARALAAGLLHDLARLYPTDRLVAECELRGLAIDAFERANPIVLHARLGAELARERYGVDDEGVLSAIRAHTIAAPVMSRLDCIVYLADGLEPGRTFPARAALASLALQDLGAAMRAVLAETIAYQQRRGLTVAPATYAAARAFGLAPVPQEKQPA